MLEHGFIQLLHSAGPSASALAYLDAGTGSIIFQWVVAGLLGATFAIKMSWRRIAEYFAQRRGTDNTDV